MKTLPLLFADNLRIPSPPVIALKILETVKDEEFSFTELARIISSDSALTAKILRVANSSFYGVSSKVTSIEKALTILGEILVRNLALSFVIMKDLKVPMEGNFNIELFWRRALTAAVAADRVTVRSGRRCNSAFVSAILQDIGVIVLYLSHPDEYRRLLEERRNSGVSLVEAERREFGLDHQEVGSELLKFWGLPEEIYLPVRHHHEPDNAPAGVRDAVMALHLSDRLAGLYHGLGGGRLPEIKELLARRIGLDDHESEELVDSVALQSMEMFAPFDMDPGTMKPYSQILQEANEELSRLNLSYEQLVLEYKLAKEMAERLTYELKEANDRLRDAASRDGLTGLFHHRSFQEKLDDELTQAYRQNYPLSLIMLDIDHFKNINDTYGHPLGDLVLKELSAVLARQSAHHGHAARYGGEEFALILPRQDLRHSFGYAEQLRTEIERLKIQVGGQSLRVTISGGVAEWKSAAGSPDKLPLIAAADRALYASKHNGRNRITAACLA